ncbi:MAG: hypothetical protein KDA92_17840, partial [Planctomycetales bacterium]|nr:hypothetical protein [Planctomycetales bacterium]
DGEPDVRSVRVSLADCALVACVGGQQVSERAADGTAQADWNAPRGVAHRIGGVCAGCEIASGS